MTLTDQEIEDLARAAREVARNAYVPASGFRVGAALLAADGQVFCGCNVENSSYGLTVCAERGAVCRAVAEGCRTFRAIVICCDADEPSPPCGACRQVLAEFGRELEVVLVGNGDRLVRTDLAELLPRPFRFRRDGPQR
jgi:cytidine deaminase